MPTLPDATHKLMEGDLCYNKIPDKLPDKIYSIISNFHLSKNCLQI